MRRNFIWVFLITVVIATMSGFISGWFFPTASGLVTRLLPIGFATVYFVSIMIIYMQNRRTGIAHIYTCTNCNKKWFSIEHTVKAVSDDTTPV
jgi:hypothetical protein